MSDSGKLRRHAKEVDSKAELRRFKNREAARRVRERKSNQLNTLQGQVDELRKENQKLLLVIHQLQTTSLTGTTSNAPALSLLPAAAPTASTRPTDSMDSNPSAAPGASPINSGVRSGPAADTLPRISAHVLEPYDSSPLNDPCIMSQPGNAVVSGALLSSSTLLPGTMSAPLLVQHSSLCLRPDEVPLQRTCGCSGDEECEECEGVRVTMCSNSNLPLITTPGPKPKPLTLEDLNLSVPVLEELELSQGTSGAVAAAGNSSKAVTSDRWQQQLLSQNSLGAQDRALLNQPQHHSAAVILGRSKSDLVSRHQQLVMSGPNAQKIAHKRQHVQHDNGQSQHCVAQKQAVGAMDLDLVETLEPTRPRAGARYNDIGSSSGNAVGPASATMENSKSYAGACYVRKGSGDAAAAVQQLDQQPEEQQQGRQKLLRMESALDTGGGAAAVVADLGFADVLEEDRDEGAERQTLHDRTGVADLMGSPACDASKDVGAVAAVSASMQQTGGSVAAPCSVALADSAHDSLGLDADDLAELIAPCPANGSGLPASAAMTVDTPSPTQAADMDATEFIPMLPSPVMTGSSDLSGHGDVRSSVRHHTGPTFLRNIAAAVGGFVKQPGSRSAATTPKAAMAAAASAPFSACAPAAALAGSVTNFAMGDLSGVVRSVRSSSETGVGHRGGLGVSNSGGVLYAPSSGIGVAAQQAAQQRQQLASDMQQMHMGSVAGGLCMRAGVESYPAGLPSPNAVVRARQQQELMLLQQQRQQQQLLMRQLQQQQQQQQASCLRVTQPNTMSGYSLPNLNQLCNSSPSMSSHMWSSLSATDAGPERFGSFSNSSPAADAAVAAASANSWPCNTNFTSAGCSAAPAYQARQIGWMGGSQRGRSLVGAAGSGGPDSLAPVLDDASEEDAVMQLALQEGVLLSGL